MLVFNSPWDNPTPLTPPAGEQLVSVRISRGTERNDLACCNFYWQLLGHWCGVLEETPAAEIRWGQRDKINPFATQLHSFSYFFLILVLPPYTADRERNQYLQWKKVCYWISKDRCRVFTWETKGQMSIFRSQTESNNSKWLRHLG